jgi:type IV pilus assembly protein PilY1
MLFTETGSPNSNTDGGYMRAAIRDLTGAHKTRFMNLLNSLSKTGDKSNGGKAGKTMSEAYQYFKVSRLSRVMARSRRTTPQRRRNTAITGHLPAARQCDQFLQRVALQQPLNGNCHNYIIYISNGAVQDNSSRQRNCDEPTGSCRGRRGHFRRHHAIPISPSGSQSNVADEWRAFMRQSSLGVVTYTLMSTRSDWPGPGLVQAPGEQASVSDGTYYSVSSAAQAARLSTRSAGSFRDTGGEQRVRLGQLAGQRQYSGIFPEPGVRRHVPPGPDAAPRWAGNLKQYKLGIVSGAAADARRRRPQAINS